MIVTQFGTCDIDFIRNTSTTVKTKYLCGMLYNKEKTGVTEKREVNIWE